MSELIGIRISAVYHKENDLRKAKIQKDAVRSEAYSLFLLTIIEMLTKKGIQPNWIFDSDKKSDADKIIHQWARDAFYGIQVNLVYMLIANGISIPEPIFVRPASRPLLELADLVSFVIARYLARSLQRSNPELDPARLGQVFYSGFDSRQGDFVFQWSNRFPMQLFFQRSTLDGHNG
ncbi:MAG: hypothetical protein HY674_11095 [Chloroflexi bacterium]|nr:hypothetical protein [Chloroflexota bacterium]